MSRHRPTAFRRWSNMEWQITVGNVSSLNLTLMAGSNETTVNVDASAPTIDTQSSDLGGTIQSRAIEELPLALGGRRRFSLTGIFRISAAGDDRAGSGKQLQRRLYVEDLRRTGIWQ